VLQLPETTLVELNVLQDFTTKVLQAAMSLMFDEADERDETLYQDDESVAKPMSEKRRADTE
jgi:hypothetical protein